MVDAYNSLFAKKEVTYNTDPVLTGAANAVACRNLSVDPIISDRIERNLDKPTRGASPTAVTNLRQGVSFEVELAGSGAAGTAAPWMELLEGCGMAAPVLFAGNRAEQKFAPLGTALSSLWLTSYRGTERRRCGGARGDISMIDFTAGAYPFIGMDFLGLLPAAPFDAVPMAGADFTRWKAPVEVNTVNTDFLLDGYAAVLRSFKAKANADVKARRLVGADYINRGNHAMTVEILIELPPVATKNYFTSLIGNAEVALQIVHGIVAGNIVQLDASYFQITAVADAEEDDVAMLKIDGQLNTRVAQDDLLLTCK